MVIPRDEGFVSAGMRLEEFIGLIAGITILTGLFIFLLIGLMWLIVSSPHSTRLGKEPLRDATLLNIHPLHTPPQSPQDQENIKWPAKAVRKVNNAKDIGSHSSSEAGVPRGSGRAVYVDNGRLVKFKFTWLEITPKPGLGDWFKAKVEVCLRHPVIWWPLHLRKTYCSIGDMRMSWYCVSAYLELFHNRKDLVIYLSNL